jgi:succinoglycan biosynthesis transport protein ExoP
MAQFGGKVILLDCDLRRPAINKIYGKNRSPGITNLLIGDKSIHQVIQSTKIAGLDIIPCGPIPPNPSELLGSKKMRNLLRVLGKKYKRIIIDSPPIAAVTDAVVLSNISDGVILVIRADQSTKDMVKNGLNQLKSLEVRVLGAVLNAVDIEKGGYYYKNYYSYTYAENTQRGHKLRLKTDIARKKIIN